MIANGGGDAGADLRSMVAATVTRDDAAAVTNGQVSLIAETIPLVCAVANVQLGIAGVEMEQVG